MDRVDGGDDSGGREKGGRCSDEGAKLIPFDQSQPLIKSQSFDGQTRISKSTFQWSKMKP